MMQGIRRGLAQAGATLFFIGMLTGLWSGAALTGKVVLDIPRLALAAHLTALLGGLWQIAVAWTFDFLHYDERGLRRLAILTIVPAWGNWLLTMVASVLGVRGLDYSPPVANQVLAGLLHVVVVLTGLAGTGLWAYGFRKRSV
jgi:hypothetical protein